jgi:hypothetical protein
VGSGTTSEDGLHLESLWGAPCRAGSPKLGENSGSGSKGGFCALSIARAS